MAQYGEQRTDVLTERVGAENEKKGERSSSVGESRVEERGMKRG